MPAQHLCGAGATFLTKCLQIRNGYLKSNGTANARSHLSRTEKWSFALTFRQKHYAGISRAEISGETAKRPQSDRGRRDRGARRRRTIGLHENTAAIWSFESPPISLQQKKSVTYYLFDLLYCDGFDLRNCELEKRKGLLQKLLRPSGKIRYSDHVVEKGTELFEIG